MKKCSTVGIEIFLKKEIFVAHSITNLDSHIVLKFKSLFYVQGTKVSRRFENATAQVHLGFVQPQIRSFTFSACANGSVGFHVQVSMKSQHSAILKYGCPIVWSILSISYLSSMERLVRVAVRLLASPVQAGTMDAWLTILSSELENARGRQPQSRRRKGRRPRRRHKSERLGFDQPLLVWKARLCHRGRRVRRSVILETS